MPFSMIRVFCEVTPSPSNGRVAMPCASVASSTSVKCSGAIRFPFSAPRKLLFLCTSNPLTAPARPSMKPAAICGSNTTGARTVFGLRAPSIRAARRAFRQCNRAAGERAQTIFREIRPIRKSEPLPDDHPQPDALGRRLVQLFHFSVADAHRRIARALGVGFGLGGAGLARELDQLFADVGQLHAPVPPTVRLSMRTVGRPTPTGTFCPSLPQVPRPGSWLASLPTALTFLSASGPTPISIAPLTGLASSPFS